MLHRAKDLQGDAIHAEDGEVGSVDDLYFNEEDWDVRYLVVNTRRWIPGRMYLVSPIAIDRESPLEGDIRIDLTRARADQPLPDERRGCQPALERRGDGLLHRGHRRRGG
jgi:hypothetical protein